MGNLYGPTPKQVAVFYLFFHAYLVSTKPMANWSRTPGQLSGGHWVEQKAEF